MYKPLSYGMKFARGSEWFALSRNFTTYLVGELEKNNSAMHEIWTDALLLYQPDETFFHTALLNSPFCKRNPNRHLHYISDILPEKIQHGDQDEIGTRSPAFLSPTDFKHIVLEKAKRPVFFVRKLNDATHQPTIKLCQQLDTIGSSQTRSGSAAWPGLLEWLQTHLAQWIGQNLTVNESCSLEGSDDLSDPEAICGLRLSREMHNQAGASAEAQRTDARFRPESWIIERTGTTGGALYRLIERFAMPSTGSAAAFGMALLVARLGTGWDETHRFTEEVNVVPRRPKRLSLATYWTPFEADVGDLPHVLVDWGNCVVKKPMHDIHFWGSPLVFESCDTPSAGIGRIRLKLKKGGKTVALAWRDFFAFDDMNEVPFKQMRRFFQLEEFESKARAKKKKRKEQLLLQLVLAFLASPLSLSGLSGLAVSQRRPIGALFRGDLSRRESRTVSSPSPARYVQDSIIMWLFHRRKSTASN